MRRRKATVCALLVTAGVAIASIAGPAEVAPGSDAASEYVKKLGCDQVKALSQAGAQKALQAWADYIVTGASRDRAYGILQRGYTDEAVASLGELLNFLKVAEAVAAGDEMVALKAVSEWGFEYYAVAATGPVGIAVWGTMKTLADIAANLNVEILAANLGTFANLVEQDARLAGAGGGDVFLDEYIRWQSDARYGVLDNVSKMRGALAEYARIEMGQNDFPYFPQWRAPENRNRVRVAADRMMHDAAQLALVRRHQSALRSQVKGLRSEVETLQAFQGWWSIIKGATCTSDLLDGANDPAGTCFKNLVTVTEMLAQLEGEAAGLGTEREGLTGIARQLDTLDAEADRLAGDLERDLTEIRNLCSDAEGDRSTVATKVAELDALKARLQRDEAEAGRLAEAACTGTEGSFGQEAAALLERIRTAASQSALVGGTLMAWTPPPKVDFSGVEYGVDAVLPELVAAAERERQRESEHQRVAEAADRAEVLLRPCELAQQDVLENDYYVREKIVGLAARVETVRGLAEEAESVPAAAAELATRADALAAFVAEQVARQRGGRACLDALPELARLEQEIAVAQSTIATLVATAEQSAARANECAGSTPLPEEPRSITVPDLAGHSERLAVTWLDELGLGAFVQRDDTPLEGSAPGDVTRQLPGGGTDVVAGTTVILWISEADPPPEGAVPPLPEAEPNRPAITQGDCDRSWPGTVLVESDGLGQCRCPLETAWSKVSNACLSLTGGGGWTPSAGGDCSHMPGTLRDSVTGECRCGLGLWDARLGRCVDPRADERSRRVTEERQAATCERLYSDIQAFLRNPVPLHRQMVNNALNQARQMGCDAGRIDQAIRSGAGWVPPPGGGSGGGQTGGSDSGTGTCHIVEYPSRGDVNLVFEQKADGNHVNVYVLSVDEESEDDARAGMAGLPGFRVAGRYGSYSAAMAAARSLCSGRTMY